MDQVKKIMHTVSQMETERLKRLIIISALLLFSLLGIFTYSFFVFIETIEELGFGDLLIILSENHEEFINILIENFYIYSEFLEIGIILSLLISLIFIIILFIKVDFPSFPKRLKETKKY
jgi:hypothetical protein